MKKEKGFTLIELMIVIGIIGTICFIVASFSTGISTEKWQHGGTLCKGGYLWNVDMERHQRQVLNEHGGGVSCK